MSGYDALGQVVESALPAVGGVPAETVMTGYRLSGTPETLTVSSVGVSTELVSSTAYDGVGRLVSRTYGNGVVREMAWDDVTGALEGLSAKFDDGGSDAFVQDVSFVRDGAQRLTQVTDTAAGGASGTADCYTYDGANRLAAAWSILGSAACASTYASQPTAERNTDPELGTEFAARWQYSDTGRITSVTDDVGTPSTSTYHYDGDTSHPNAVDSITDTNSATIASYTYDDAGRMTSRTVGSATTTFTWDVSSNLVATSGAGGERVYLYDASGQRVAQIKTDAATGDPATATAYFGATEVTDPNTSASSEDDLTATRSYAFGGATVAVQVWDGSTSSWSLLFGDQQGRRR